MFNKGNTSGGRKGADTGLQGSLNLIGSGTVIKGDVETAGDIRIDGTLVGTLRSNARVVLGETAVVEGNIFCQNADVSGTIKGNANVNEMLTLKPTSRLDGDIEAGHVVMEAGAVFNGNCKTKEHGTAGEGKPEKRSEGKVLETA